MQTLLQQATLISSQKSLLVKMRQRMSFFPIKRMKIIDLRRFGGLNSVRETDVYEIASSHSLHTLSVRDLMVCLKFHYLNGHMT